MIKDATKQIIKRTLQSSFDKEQFLNFTKNLLNHINEDKAFHAHGHVKEQFKKTANIIRTYERLGTYTDPNAKKIDILVVYLAKDNSIDRARTSLRNFVADYLKGRDQKDAALVAFVSPSQDDWRFSLIKMEYKFEESASGKMKVKEEFTPARRWSFLVGSKESSHTAQSRLAPILEDDVNSPTLEELEEAFNIEKVTKEFFEKYRELFLGLKDNLDEMVKNDAKIKADFAEKDVDTVDFAKKLLGQIVFLYFLQKKGWFGVERDANWGTGPKDFLRQLYNKKHSDYKNFFNEILEPMFYEALARERDDDYYGRFNCKIPFLNGGLFDPIGNYDWVHTDINLDNELFSNSRPTKQGDTGDGILDVFDRYNFTVREDEPLEKEVAVDPEMLGKVFENLLEVKDRKSKGTYYTPREIVHYMCEQSLINYLATELPEVGKDDLEEFIKIGDRVLEKEYWATQKGDGGGSKIPASIKENAETIDQKLAEIKVCDPAIGSGAFPVGMMGEIVDARLALNPFLCHSGLDPEFSSLECAGRSAYDFKMQAITNSIYGVDIDPGAVEIAKLRLWLSLVVDENDIKQIKPLPNLDYKIMQGNSLLEEFEGIKLFDESIIPQDHADRETQITNANKKINDLQREFISLHSNHQLSKSQEQMIKQQIKSQQKLIQSLQEKPKQGGTVDLFNQIDEIKAKWDELTGLHQKIVNESNRQNKREMLRRASELEWQFIEATLKREGKSESLKKIEQFKKKNTKPFFLWHLHFAEVFQRKGGFDLVIANPPYVSLEKIDNHTNKALKGVSEIYSGKADLLYFFFEKGIKLLHDRGLLSFITSRYYLEATFAKRLRQFMLTHGYIKNLIDFHNQYVFENVGIHALLTFFEKHTLPRDIISTKVAVIKDSCPNLLDVPFFKVKLDDDSWILTSASGLSLLNKIKDGTIPLGQMSVIEQGQKTGKNDVYVLPENDARFLEQEPLKKLIKNSNIEKYYIEYKNQYLIYADDAFNIDQYPNIRKYLLQHREVLSKRAEAKDGIYPWYRLQRPRDKNLFDSPIKIVTPYRSEYNRFAYDDQQYYNDGGDIRIIVLNNPSAENYKFCLGILNSSLMNYFFHFIGRKKGKAYEYFKDSLEKIPIKIVSEMNQLGVIDLVDKIISITGSSAFSLNQEKQALVKKYERRIDQMVYKLYDLTPDEIKIVEGIE